MKLSRFSTALMCLAAISATGCFMPGAVFKIKPPTRTVQVAQKAPRAQKSPAVPPADTVRTELLAGMVSGAHPSQGSPATPPSEGPEIEEVASGDTTAQKSGDIAGYAYREIGVSSFHQAYFSPAWNNNAFKYLSIDGLRYSQSIIMNQAVDPEASIFFLAEDGSLGIPLEEAFEMEVTFYPPNEPGHETFDPFDIVVVNRKNEVVCREHVAKRMQKYKIAR
jgi:hypothetical protein